MGSLLSFFELREIPSIGGVLDVVEMSFPMCKIELLIMDAADLASA